MSFHEFTVELCFYHCISDVSRSDRESSPNHHNYETLPEKEQILIFPLNRLGSDEDEEKKKQQRVWHMKNLIELKISIRCLATTLWFFSSQMCTFFPGIFLFGCEMTEEQEQTGKSDEVRA